MKKNNSKFPMILENIENESNIISENIQGILESIKNKHHIVSKIRTPKGLVKQKLGFDYVELSYMKKIANEEFPGWSWTIVKSEALGSNSYVVHGRLKWFDDGLWRKGDMVAAHRIQIKRGGSENDFVDIGNDIKSANTDCFKKALNVYMDIAADVYRSEDPELSDEQIKTIRALADEISADKLIEMDTLIADGKLNSHNYDGSLAKLRRLAG